MKKPLKSLLKDKNWWAAELSLFQRTGRVLSTPIFFHLSNLQQDKALLSCACWWGTEQAVTYCLPEFALQSQGQKSALAGMNSLFHPSWCCPEPRLYSPSTGRGSRGWHLQKVLPSSLCWCSKSLEVCQLYLSFAERNLWGGINLKKKGENKNFSLDLCLTQLTFPLLKGNQGFQSPCQRNWAQGSHCSALPSSLFI